MQYDPSSYDGAAVHYRYGRPAYSPRLEALLAEELGLDGSGRLLDPGPARGHRPGGHGDPGRRPGPARRRARELPRLDAGTGRAHHRRSCTATHFDIPQPAHRIEAAIAPTNEGGIYYTEPSEDWSRPGRMWWSVPDGVETFSTWKEVTVVYHEGVPGHHLQVSNAVAAAESLNRWQRMSWVSGHGEGWALYAERLMGELGYLDDPGAYLGMLDSQQLLAVQVPLDIGVHLELDVPRGTGWREGERWNAEIAWELLRAHSSWDERQLRSELRRCLGMPGQAPSYKLGERIWLQAREDAKARAGSSLQPQGLSRQGTQPGRYGP